MCYAPADYLFFVIVIDVVVIVDGSINFVVFVGSINFVVDEYAGTRT